MKTPQAAAFYDTANGQYAFRFLRLGISLTSPTVGAVLNLFIEKGKKVHPLVCILPVLFVRK